MNSLITINSQSQPINSQPQPINSQHQGLYGVPAQQGWMPQYETNTVLGEQGHTFAQL